MKLWLIGKRGGLAREGDPWRPWYDKAYGFVVRAETEADARRLANENGGDERREIPGVYPWLDSEFSTCVELTADGERGVVLCNFANG